AIADFDDAIRLEPDDSAHHAARGQAFSANGDYDRALADYADVLVQRDLEEAPRRVSD
ncbi:MAG: tetratricopeptide repeat protein, partial [Planctomycetota bacterium]